MQTIVLCLGLLDGADGSYIAYISLTLSLLSVVAATGSKALSIFAAADAAVFEIVGVYLYFATDAISRTTGFVLLFALDTTGAAPGIAAAAIVLLDIAVQFWQSPTMTARKWCTHCSCDPLVRLGNPFEEMRTIQGCLLLVFSLRAQPCDGVTLLLFPFYVLRLCVICSFFVIAFPFEMMYTNGVSAPGAVLALLSALPLSRDLEDRDRLFGISSVATMIIGVCTLAVDRGDGLGDDLSIKAATNETQARSQGIAPMTICTVCLVLLGLKVLLYFAVVRRLKPGAEAATFHGLTDVFRIGMSPKHDLQGNTERFRLLFTKGSPVAVTLLCGRHGLSAQHSAAEIRKVAEVNTALDTLVTLAAERRKATEVNTSFVPLDGLNTAYQQAATKAFVVQLGKACDEGTCELRELCLIGCSLVGTTVTKLGATLGKEGCKLETLRLLGGSYELGPLIAAIRMNGTLTTLDLSHNELNVLPAEIGQLVGLNDLNLSGNELTLLPVEIGQLGGLEMLDLSRNKLTSLPVEVGQLTGLEQLDLSHNQLTLLPNEVGQLGGLKGLNLSSNRLASLPAEVGQLGGLTNLDLSDNKLTLLPAEIGLLVGLTDLNLSRNQLTLLPVAVGQLAGWFRIAMASPICGHLGAMLKEDRALTTLDLSHNMIADEGVRQLCVGLETNTTLVSLNLSNNRFGDAAKMRLRSREGANRLRKGQHLNVNFEGQVRNETCVVS